MHILLYNYIRYNTYSCIIIMFDNNQCQMISIYIIYGNVDTLICVHYCIDVVAVVVEINSIEFNILERK